MPRIHKIVDGGEDYLGWALARERQMRASLENDAGVDAPIIVNPSEVNSLRARDKRPDRERERRWLDSKPKKRREDNENTGHRAAKYDMGDATIEIRVAREVSYVRIIGVDVGGVPGEYSCLPHGDYDIENGTLSSGTPWASVRIATKVAVEENVQHTITESYWRGTFFDADGEVQPVSARFNAASPQGIELFGMGNISVSGTELGIERSIIVYQGKKFKTTHPILTCGVASNGVGAQVLLYCTYEHESVADIEYPNNFIDVYWNPQVARIKVYAIDTTVGPTDAPEAYEVCSVPILDADVGVESPAGTVTYGALKVTASQVTAETNTRRNRLANPSFARFSEDGSKLGVMLFPRDGLRPPGSQSLLTDFSNIHRRPGIAEFQIVVDPNGVATATYSGTTLIGEKSSYSKYEVEPPTIPPDWDYNNGDWIDPTEENTSTSSGEPDGVAVQTPGANGWTYGSFTKNFSQNVSNGFTRNWSKQNESVMYHYIAFEYVDGAIVPVYLRRVTTETGSSTAFSRDGFSSTDNVSQTDKSNMLQGFILSYSRSYSMTTFYSAGGSASYTTASVVGLYFGATKIWESSTNGGIESTSSTTRPSASFSFTTSDPDEVMPPFPDAPPKTTILNRTDTQEEIAISITGIDVKLGQALVTSLKTTNQIHYVNAVKSQTYSAVAVAESIKGSKKTSTTLLEVPRGPRDGTTAFDLSIAEASKWYVSHPIPQALVYAVPWGSYFVSFNKDSALLAIDKYVMPFRTVTVQADPNKYVQAAFFKTARIDIKSKFSKSPEAGFTIAPVSLASDSLQTITP